MKGILQERRERDKDLLHIPYEMLGINDYVRL